MMDVILLNGCYTLDGVLIILCIIVFSFVSAINYMVMVAVVLSFV